MNTFARRFAAGSLVLAITASPALASTATRDAAGNPPSVVETAPAETPSPLLLAQDSGSGGGSLADFEKAQDTGGYNSDYIFALTRGLANSTMHPAGKMLLFPFAIVLDIPFSPFAVIAGFFN